MRAKGWNWDEAILDTYLQNPQAMIPGIEMPFSIPDPSERRDIIAYIASLTSVPAQVAAAASVFDDWRQDKPGRRHKIGLNDLPQPYETRSAGSPPREVKRPVGTKPKAPDGFTVTLFAEGLESPRAIRTAPNGDLFVAETLEGRVTILRPGAEGDLAQSDVFASGLSEPFGIAFYPAGPNPKWVYVAESNRVIRFAYKGGDLKSKAPAEVVVRALAPTLGGHVTRDLAFSLDGKRMFVSVGSASNDAEGLPSKSQREIDSWQARKGIGAAWGFEENRADVLVYSPEGKDASVYATGLRNCAGMAVQPGNGDLYCATNERDGLGDNLPPDYVTRVHEGQFFGWPWLYMGDHEDPRWKGARPDLAVMVTSPDVLLQPHSAPQAITFLDGAAFPSEYHGSAFVALHGSWNRTERTGYKVVRVIMRDGAPTGEYEDFLTGFVIDESRVWGRPAGIAEGKDGALYITEDSGGSIWRIVYAGPADHRAANAQ